MQRILLTVFVFLILSMTCVNNSYSMAQISLQNNTSSLLNLYIDGNFGCGPVLPNGFCTSSVNPGARVLEARKRGSSEPIVPAETVNIGDGTSPTWTVTIEDTDLNLIKRLNGARFVNKRNWPTIEAEYELNISGITLVWRMRFTWAAPRVVLPRPIGTWSELGRGQIVGREAHIYIQNPVPDDVKFTISDDGNSITYMESSGTFTFYRQ